MSLSALIPLPLFKGPFYYLGNNCFWIVWHILLKIIAHSQPHFFYNTPSFEANFVSNCSKIFVNTKLFWTQNLLRVQIRSTLKHYLILQKSPVCNKYLCCQIWLPCLTVQVMKVLYVTEVVFIVTIDGGWVCGRSS